MRRIPSRNRKQGKRHLITHCPRWERKVPDNSRRKNQDPYASGKARAPLEFLWVGTLISRRGASFTTDGYVSGEMGIGRLAVECIVGGGILKINTALKKKLRVGEETKTKKCAIPALAEGVGWAAQGKPKRRPSRRRVDVLACGIMLCEIIGAEQSFGQTTGVDLGLADDVGSFPFLRCFGSGRRLPHGLGGCR